jgi:hypothetical protein
MSWFRAMLRCEEESAMGMRLQKVCIDVETFDVINAANYECPEQLWGVKPVSPTSQCRQPAKATLDQEYVSLMEERYGIREEGIF